MLIVTTNISCPTIDRVNVRISRGAETAPTFDRVFALTGDGCSTAMNLGLPTIPLGVRMGAAQEYRLGIVDGRRTSDRVRVELVALGQTMLTTVVETDFVDDKVYAVPIQLATQCQGFTGCPSGYTCRTVSDNSGPVCGSIYRTPGTVGRIMATSSIVSDDEVSAD